MKGFILQLATASAAITLFARADAAEIYAIKLDKGGTALVVTGTILPGDGAKFRAEAVSDNPVFLAQREHFYAGLRLAGVPEGWAS